MRKFPYIVSFLSVLFCMGCAFANLEQNKNPVFGIYSITSGGVYLSGYVGHSEFIHKKISVDVNTFQEMGDYYAKDAKYIYWLGSVITGGDVQTFSIMKNGFAKDKKSVYRFGDKARGKIDAKTFTLLDYGYAKDKKNIYKDIYKISDVDYATFEPLGYGSLSLGEGYARDKYSVYRNDKKIIGADTGTFVIISGSPYTKDKNNVYEYYGEKLLWADPTTFEVLQDGYIKDKNTVYCFDWKIKGVDASTFVQLSGEYSKDKKSVYYQSSYDDGNPAFLAPRVDKIIGADPKTFEVFKYKQYFYAKDIKYVYDHGKRMTGANPATFMVFDYGLAKDGDQFYIHGKQATKLQVEEYQKMYLSK